MIQMNFYTKRNKLKGREKNLQLPKVKGSGGGINLELGISRYKLLYVK